MLDVKLTHVVSADDTLLECRAVFDAPPVTLTHGDLAGS
jgi:hypothetical protein